jgi:hypothetical protein
MVKMHFLFILAQLRAVLSHQVIAVYVNFLRYSQISYLISLLISVYSVAQICYSKLHDLVKSDEVDLSSQKQELPNSTDVIWYSLHSLHS